MRAPNESVIERHLLMLGFAVLSVVLLFRVGQGLLTGVAPSMQRAGVAGAVYTLQEHPPQFWFAVGLHLAGGLIFGWLAWRRLQGDSG